MIPFTIYWLQLKADVTFSDAWKVFTARRAARGDVEYNPTCPAEPWCLGDGLGFTESKLRLGRVPADGWLTGTVSRQRISLDMCWFMGSKRTLEAFGGYEHKDV